MRKLIVIFIATSLLYGCYSCDGKEKLEEYSDDPIVLFYTNDEHGWVEADLEKDGAAGLMGLWKSREGYDGSDRFLILSGGDMWTGPALSTWYKGEPMVEVMNAMEYDAAALGNHEFDFKIEGLESRSGQMEFPLVCANIKNRSDGQIPDFAQAYMIEEVGELKIGIIGLANTVTPFINFSFVDENYKFTSYATALEEYVPQMKSEGAELIILISHLCDNEMLELLPLAKSYGISIIGGGHCHPALMSMEDGVLLIKGGGYMSGYAKVELKYSDETGEVEFVNYELVENKNSGPDQAITAIVDKWKEELDEALSEEIAFCSDIIYNGTPEMSNLVCDSWLHKFPEADISVTNGGGIRQNIPAGFITKKTIVGLLPFDNEILELDLTGAQVVECIGQYLLVGGMTGINGYKHMDGTPLKMDSVYKVLTTDYLYSLSSSSFSVYDETPVYTSANYQDPTIEFLQSLNTSASDPLENYLDYTPRR